MIDDVYTQLQRHSCTGCAPAVVEAYRRDGFGLVLKACNGAAEGQGGAAYLEVRRVRE